MKYRIPYGKGAFEFEPPEGSNCAVLMPDHTAGGEGLTEDEIVQRAMEAPIGSVRLRDMARGKRNAVIIISDHTRPVPSKRILPHMLAELRDGNPDIDITLLVATGFHRLSHEEELRAKLGDEIFDHEKIVIHDSSNADSNMFIGVLPSGGRLVIDRIAVEADLLVSEGFIEPHFFAGFSGGRKSILPGICDRVTVLANHSGAFIASPFARTGVLEGNPIHRDMLAAAKMAKLAFIVNVIIDEDKKVTSAFAGDPFLAHKAGCEKLRSECVVKSVPSDIVITGNGGAPLDQNLYQSVKCMTAAEGTAKPGATLIILAECADGTGGDGFYNAIKNAATPRALMLEAESTPMGNTLPDQWEYQILARILDSFNVIMVTDKKNADIVRDMKMTWEPDLESAVQLALQRQGRDASFAVIPNGVSVIVEQ